MICKVCNATIDDNAQVCPFCGANTTVNVDPGFPDPASPQGGVDLNKPAEPSVADLGLSEPAQYTDPMASANQNAQPYANNVGDAPTGQPVQPSYSQNSYDQNYSSYNAGSPELESEAKTIFTLGLVSLIVGFCCCALVGPICGGIGISKYSKLQPNLSMLSEDAQKKANTGRILCIIGCVVGGLSMVINGIMSATGAYSGMMEQFQ